MLFLPALATWDEYLEPTPFTSLPFQTLRSCAACVRKAVAEGKQPENERDQSNVKLQKTAVFIVDLSGDYFLR